MKTVLVVGYNTRHICASAKKAGFNVFSIEHFGDRDLFEIADEVVVFEDSQVDNDTRESDIGESMKRFDYDALVCGPGFEQSNFGTELSVLNNDKKLVEKVSDKFWLSEYLTEIGVKHPSTFLLEDVVPSTLKYPVMVKPRSGAGGVKNLLVLNSEQLEEIKWSFNDFIVQEYIEGVTASVSLIAACGEACSIGTSEEISGFPWLTNIPYAYSGSITPSNYKHVDVMKELAENVVCDLMLVGSNGVDFLLSDKGLFLLEINPRFQGTLETVEHAYKLNVFSMHVAAFSGELPQPVSAKCFAGRAILFAKNDVWIDQRMSDLLFDCYKKETASDVPWHNTLILKDKPIVTFFAAGTTRAETLTKLRNITNETSNGDLF
ncbi:MAG: ATP-grasp domain protein [Candidatus Argoarchaeum ethanivorans]|uniref:ATP-grasp domain protein n=1 Tax=Candidatus Argoarchaeum ethanivorans TaxID=2608793 RepID=A0A811T9S8_9EURY|nr:MAG: ATP-grasp domain protein [Candidatus Argoarchaeum ethanivorans]